VQSIYLTDEHAEFRRTVAEFLAASVSPYASDWERDRKIPRTAWKALGARGLLGLAYPPELGGGGRSLFHVVVFLEELGRTGYAGLRAAVAVHAHMATHYLATSGSAELQQAYLVPAMRGEKIAALAITEPGAGSDLGRLTTVADAEGEDFVVSGQKAMVTNGTTADFYVVAVRTTPQATATRRGVTGLSLLVMDADGPGITATAQEKLGWHCSDTATVCFDDVIVPSSHLVGRRDSGFYYLMRGFQLERLVAAALAIGGADHCLEQTIAHVRRREAFDSTLSSLQAVRHRLADLAAHLAAARQLVYHAAWRYGAGGLAVEECSMAKLIATELACEIADASLQLHGASGYVEGAVAGRSHRDARAATIAAGPSEVMRDIIAHLVIDEGGRA
jgi:acyl-CoA dehydrogenase